MKKVITFVLFMVLCVIFARRCYYESQRPRGLPDMSSVVRNKQLSSYSGVKVRGTSVKALFSAVENLNSQQIFPIDIRYGDVLPDSYEWTVQTTQNLNSGDFIRDSAWFEVVMQDQLPKGKVDMYLDTITIRAYQQPVTTNNVTSPSGE